MRAYFDYNATAPLRPEVRAVLEQLFEDALANPSSPHAEGRRARAHVEHARATIMGQFGARGLVFTSGATEANNLALRGFARRERGGCIVTTATDHASILATAAALADEGYRVVVLAVDRAGKPDFDHLRALTRKHPCLVSTSWANGETGHTADLEALTDCIAPGSILHLDAAQAVGRLPVGLYDGVALVSVSSHKLGGPMGIGALLSGDEEWPLRPILTGGPHENGLRAGTENVPAIVGFAAAVGIACSSLADEAPRLAALRERLWSALEAEVPGLIRITPNDGLCNTLTVAAPSPSADVLVAGLDLEGFAVSTGSACAAGAPEPSHVIRALGLAAPHRDGVVRMSMGYNTTGPEVDALAQAFGRIVARARKAA